MGETKTVKDLVIESEKHVVKEEHIAEMDVFFKQYKPLEEEEMKLRFKGVIGKLPNMPTRSMLKSIWATFLENERFDYIVSNNTVDMDQIVKIGFDKFVLTNGWNRSSDVKKWRNNKLRIGVCPHCQDQFVPLVFQVNYGLCSGCRPDFSLKSIRKYIDYVGSTDERYAGAEQDLLMNFFILFYTDINFRVMFTKGHPFAKKYEEMEFELSESMKQAKENMAKRIGAAKGDFIDA